MLIKTLRNEELLFFESVKFSHDMYTWYGKYVVIIVVQTFYKRDCFDFTLKELTKLILLYTLNGRDKSA